MNVTDWVKVMFFTVWGAALAYEGVKSYKLYQRYRIHIKKLEARLAKLQAGKGNNA